MSDSNGKPPKKRWSVFRFSLLTMVMLITASVILVEKPLRKSQGKRKLAKAAIQNVSPSQLEWSPELAPWFIEMVPKSWLRKGDYEGVELVRLTHNAVAPEGEVPEYMKRPLEWAANDRNMIELILKYPDATEDLRSLITYHTLTDEMEDWIVSRSKLRVIEIRSRGPFRDEFIRRIAKLKHLVVLTLSEATPEQVEFLKTMKSLKWLQVATGDEALIESLRDALPNTYVD